LMFQEPNSARSSAVRQPRRRGRGAPCRPTAHAVGYSLPPDSRAEFLDRLLPCDRRPSAVGTCCGSAPTQCIVGGGVSGNRNSCRIRSSSMSLLPG
jgi:hypothetical protein